MPTILPIGQQVLFIEPARPPTTYDPAVYIIRLGAYWLDLTNANRPMLWWCFASTPTDVRWLRIPDLGGDYKDNVFIGRNSGEAIAAGANGDANVAIGNDTMKEATTAYQSVAIGQGAMASQISGNFNTAVGAQALDAATTAALNTAIGAAALGDATTGGSNTAVGVLALQALTTGANNTAVGVNAGFNVSNENNLTLVGQGTNINAGVSSAVVLGINGKATENGSFALGGMSYVGTAGPVVAYLRVNINGTPLRIALQDI